MYDELIKALHEGAEFLECSTPGIKNSFAKMCHNAADAIGELICEVADEHNGRSDAEERQRWIPVAERLPSYGDWVLGIGPKKGYYVCEYRGVTHWRRDGCDPWFSAKGSSVTITHWMPLPEPPKEEI
jgi:hypothetical protein